jgi:hypothetical protein
MKYQLWLMNKPLIHIYRPLATAICQFTARTRVSPQSLPKLLCMHKTMARLREAFRERLCWEYISTSQKNQRCAGTGEPKLGSC